MQYRDRMAKGRRPAPAEQSAARHRPGPVAAQGARAVHAYYQAGAARQLLALLAAGDRRQGLARVRAPTLVIHGIRDPLLPIAAGRDTARHIPGARMLEIEGMEHDLPPALTPRIVDAIARHCRDAEASYKARGSG